MRKKSYADKIRSKNARRKFSLFLKNPNQTCVYCEKPLTLETATIDHIIPISKGGTGDLSNCAAACQHCNTLSGNMATLFYNAKFQNDLTIIRKRFLFNDFD